MQPSLGRCPPTKCSTADHAASSVEQTVFAFLESGGHCHPWIQTAKGVLLLRWSRTTAHGRQSMSSIDSASNGTCSRSKVAKTIHIGEV